MIELFAILADGVVQVGPIEDLNIYTYGKEDKAEIE
jgi:hypothetical protein